MSDRIAELHAARLRLLQATEGMTPAQIDDLSATAKLRRRLCLCTPGYKCTTCSP